jgi:hypothetical protein
MKKWLEYSFLDYFLTEKTCGLGPRAMDVTGALVHHGPPNGADWRPPERVGALARA